MYIQRPQSPNPAELALMSAISDQVLWFQTSQLPKPSPVGKAVQMRKPQRISSSDTEVKVEGKALDPMLNINETSVYYKHAPEGPKPQKKRIEKKASGFEDAKDCKF